MSGAWNIATAQTKPATTTTLAVTSAGSVITTVSSGSVVTLTATVVAGSTPVTPGQVNFCDASAKYCSDIHLLGTAQLTSAGTATVKSRPGIGSHSYKAVFLGTNAYAGSSSGASALAVTGSIGTTPFASTTTIAQSGSAGNYTLTATVSGPGPVAPTGTVSFLDTSYGNAVLGSASLTPGLPTILDWVNFPTPITGQNLGLPAVGDFNDDGIPDLAIPNNVSNTVTILLGNGDGTFRASSVTSASFLGVSFIAVGDFNGDGNADMAVVNGTSVTIMLGHGDGTFTESSNLPTGGDTWSAAVGDFNNDGNEDLAIANATNSTLTILLGNGDGTFREVASPSTGSGPFGVAVGDFNGDGIPDLAVANFDGGVGDTVTILLGNGDGTFTPGATLDTAVGPRSIAVADYNGDGKLDLAVADEESCAVSIFLGNGDGTFASSGGVDTGLYPTTIALGDFNGDGIADLATANYEGNTVTVLLGNGDGTFTLASQSPQTGNLPLFLTAGDFNGDGVSDLAIPNSSNGTLTLLISQPAQTGTATVTGISPLNPGQHFVDASYPGDSNYSSSLSGTTSITAVLATPVISPASGNFISAQPITITDATPGTTIYYEAYGAIYTSGFVQYTGPIPMEGSGTLTIQAYATVPGYQQSQTATATYTLSFPPAVAPVFSLAAGSYSGPQTVTISDTTPGATIYYTTNGAQPTTNSAQYTGTITVSSSETVVASAIAPGYSMSVPASAQYIIDSAASSFIFTVAGNGIAGYSGDGGPATQADLNDPRGVVVDSAGNIYIADAENNVIRKVAAGTGVVTTFAGTGIGGYSGDNGPATSAQLLWPSSVALDSTGNLWILDGGNGKIRVVDATTGTITTHPVTGPTPTGFALDGSNNLYVIANDQVWEVNSPSNVLIAGSGNWDYSGDNGPATSATLADPTGIAVDGFGNVYIADTYNSAIRKVTRSTGIITTVAGNSSNEATPSRNYGYGVSGYSGDGGPATSADLNYPFAVTFDGAGNLYIADTYNFAIRKVTTNTGIITTVAGNGEDYVATGGDGGPATSSAVSGPQGLSFDGSGNLYVAETWWDRIREVTASGPPPTATTATPVFSVAAGTYVSPQTVTITDSTLGAAFYVQVNPTVPVSPGSPTVSAELAAPGYYRGPINVTGTTTIQVVAVAPGYLPSSTVTSAYTITTPPSAVITTVAGNGTGGFSGNGGPATSAEFGFTQGLSLDKSGDIYFTDTTNNVVWMVAQGSGTISIVAGNGSQGYKGDNGLAVNAELYQPSAVAVDNAGNLYIADSNNNVVREVAAGTGVITTIAGVHGQFGYPGHNGDGGVATAAYLNGPSGLAFDKTGNLYIADSNEGLVRVISASTGFISTFAGGRSGNETNANNGDGGPATSALLTGPGALAFDTAGNLYIGESQGRVRMVAANSGIITTVAGDGDSGTSGDGGLATNAEISAQGLAVDAAGNLFISGYGATVREVAASTGIISPVAGNGIFGYSGDGGSATAAGISGPAGIALDASGNLYIADSDSYRIRKVTFPGPAPAPTFSVAAGTYHSIQTVSITDSVQGAAFYYTTDGSTPTTGSALYSGPLTVSASETLQAIAVATGYTESPVATAAYTIDLPVTPTITWQTPAAITFGTALSATQLDATATVDGTFAYTPAAGTVLPAGSQTLSVTFTPTDSIDYTTATATVQLTVNKAIPTVTATPSATSITTAQTLSVAVQVSGGSGNPTPTGAVTLTGGGYTSAAATLSSGAATIVVPANSLSAGSDTLTVTFTPDSSSSSNYNGATGTASVAVTAPGPTASTVTVTPSSASITNEQSDTVSITVTGTGGSAAPTGTITLSSGSYSSQQTLSGGAASFNIPAGTLSDGANTLTAAYSGDATYNSSTGTASVTVTQVVTTAPSPTAVNPGASATATVTLTAGSTYSGTMNISCTLATSPTGAQDLPACSLNPASVTLTAGGSGTTQLTVTTTASSTSSLAPSSEPNPWRLGGGAILAAMLMLGIPAKRRRWLSMLALLAVVAVAGVLGCGGGQSSPPPVTNPGTTAGVYTFIVAGADSANSTITTSTIVKINVQ